MKFDMNEKDPQCEVVTMMKLTHMDENNDMENHMICMKVDINECHGQIVAEINNTNDWKMLYGRNLI
jgi:hypothetical protein